MNLRNFLRGSPGLEDAPTVQFDHVSSSFDGHPALRDVSFVAPAGKITIVMGERGSGKSLLMRHLLGDTRPDTGDVRIGSHTIGDLSRGQLRRVRSSIGVFRGGNHIVESEVSPRKSVVRNVNRQLRKSDRHESGEQRRELADRYLAEFDLRDAATARPEALDPNQRRRVAIAAALLPDPPLVVLDDPGPGIDVTHLESLSRSIEQWHHRTGSTVLLTTHSIELAKGLGDNLVVLCKGQLVAQGDPADLLSKIKDTHGFETEFGTALSYSEADPERLRRDLHRPCARALLTIVVLLVLIAVFTIVLFYS